MAQAKDEFAISESSVQSDLSCNCEMKTGGNCSRRVCAHVWRLHISFPWAQQYWWLLCHSYDSSFPTLETQAGSFYPLGNNRRKKSPECQCSKGICAALGLFCVKGEILCTIITFFIWRQFPKQKQVWNLSLQSYAVRVSLSWLASWTALWLSCSHVWFPPNN